MFCFITRGSIAEKLNELIQNDNAKKTYKINQETKVENSQKVELLVMCCLWNSLTNMQ
jgi:hypothetical protein